MMVNTTTDNPRRGEVTYGLRRAIEALKEAVPVEAYAATLTELRPSGTSLRGRCPIHNGDNEGAFLVDADQRRWHCFRCNEGGDVIDLCRAVEGGEVWEALIFLAERFNVELPKRPARWHAWNGEKHERRNMARQALAGVYQRRLFRIYAPILDGIGDKAERQEEAALLWKDLRPAAVAAAEYRVSGR